jgi:hypothetical protein
MKREKEAHVTALSFKRWSSVLIIVAALAGSSSAAHFHRADSGTGNSMTLIIDTTIHPTINGLPMGAGDEIAVFDSLDSCYGWTRWDSLLSNQAFTVWGQNSESTTKDGMASGEKLRFRVWDSTANLEMAANVAYYPLASPTPTADSLYVTNGISIPSSLAGLSAPSAPALSLPANGATGQATALTFSWTAAGGATSSALQVSLVSTFTTTVSSQTGITGTTRAVTGLANATTYYWRADAANSVGTSAWSGIWNFTTSVAVPAAPVLALPANNATGQATALTLSWTAATGATSYSVQVSLASTFATTVANQTAITATSVAESGLAGGTTYYWRADAANGAGTGAWSSVWHFATLAAPAAPVLSLPANGATNQAAALTVSWNASTGATTYAVQVSTVSTFASFFTNQTGLAVADAPLAGLTYGSTYYWRASATNTVGTSAWSTVWSFSTLAVPGAPVLATPANGATGQASPVAVTWTAVAGAATYTVQVSAVSTFTTTVSSQTGVAAATASVTGLAGGTTYYWRVDATNAAGTSAWSSVWNFATLAAPAAPVLASPTTGATNQALAPTLTWGAVTGAASYGCQVSTVSTFTSQLLNQAGLTAVSTTAAGLVNSTTYYWRANATNAAGTSTWTGAWSFTTIPPTTGVMLSSPANAAINQPTTLTMTWGVATGAISYTLQVSLASTFATFVSNQAGLTGTSAAVTGLTNGTTYYWRANVLNAGGTGAWSSIWSFTTIPAIPAVPTLTTPTNGAGFAQNATVTLVWGTVTGATAYTVQVATASTFASTVFSQNGAAVTAAFVNSSGMVHYWRVNAANAGGTSAWSAVRSFNTTTAVPPTVAEAREAAPVSFAHGALSYSLVASSRVEITLFDILGRQAFSSRSMQAAGSYRLPLDAALRAGRYVLRFSAGGVSRDMAIMITR